ncbi:MAG: GyrI-like domain-containing protein [Anaerolineales bacterium]
MTQFDIRNKGAWQWTMMITQPEYVTAALFADTLHEVAEKKKLSALNRVRFERFAEGRAAQIMHLGPYSAEGPTVARLHDYIHQNGHTLRGKHHEIYLGDPRKTAPEKWRTVIRQPFQ